MAQNKNKIKVVWLAHTVSVINTIAATRIYWLTFAKYILQTIQEWHLFLLIGEILLVDVLFLLPVTAVPSAILKSVLVQLPHSVSTCSCKKYTPDGTYAYAPKSYILLFLGLSGACEQDLKVQFLHAILLYGPPKVHKPGCHCT